MNINIEWDCVETVPDIDDIKSVETEWNISFPDDYISCIQKNQGGCPDRNTFDVDGEKYIFISLLSFNPIENYILDIYDNVKEIIPADIFPFADSRDGSLICFDYSNNESNPNIVYWNQEKAVLGESDSVLYVCDSFSELLDVLNEPESDEEYVNSTDRLKYTDIDDEDFIESEPASDAEEGHSRNTSYDEYIEKEYEEYDEDESYD